ncbi:MAG TPA: 3-carboxy-cis,cis-muconate cycloisomerase [Burkholderiaceae bacterium]
MTVFEGFLSTPEMRELWGERAFVQAMLDVEAALARAQAEAGLVPAAAAEAIAAACEVERVDAGAIVAASGRAGSLAIPLVKALTEAVAHSDAAAARWVHWGSTSQDVVDSASVLLTRRALALVERDLDRLTAALFDLAAQHGQAPLLARTLLQPAQVVSLGLKLSHWIAPLVRARERLARDAAQALQLQLGGAVGTLAVMGERGAEVARRMAEALRLALPAAPWHTERDAWVVLGCSLGVLAGTLGKLARDWSLLTQAEVGELAEPSGEGRGGSTAMPHKRNPVACMLALAAAERVPARVAALLHAMAQEHERGLGNWQAEGAEWAGLFVALHGGLKALADAAEGLQVDTERMRANIDRLHELVYAEALAARLAPGLGKAQAHARVEDWSRTALRERRWLSEVAREALAADASQRDAIGAAEWDALFDPDAAAAPARRLAAARLVELRAQWQAAQAR